MIESEPVHPPLNPKGGFPLYDRMGPLDALSKHDGMDLMASCDDHKIESEDPRQDKGKGKLDTDIVLSGSCSGPLPLDFWDGEPINDGAQLAHPEGNETSTEQDGKDDESGTLVLWGEEARSLEASSSLSTVQREATMSDRVSKSMASESVAAPSVGYGTVRTTNQHNDTIGGTSRYNGNESSRSTPHPSSTGGKTKGPPDGWYELKPRTNYTSE